jgi:hypothetical protein
MLTPPNHREDTMKQHLIIVTLVAALAQPAGAVTFPSLTTIYVGSGVRDDGGASGVGSATTFHCSNVSGVAATIRFLVLYSDGEIAISFPTPVQHGRTYTASTHATVAYIENTSFNVGSISEGVINIESTQSGVFCNAKSIDASTVAPIGVTLPLVRVNPHPGTVE